MLTKEDFLSALERVKDAFSRAGQEIGERKIKDFFRDNHQHMIRWLLGTPRRSDIMAMYERLAIIWKREGKLLDVGAGLSAFGPIAAATGMFVEIVDDFHPAEWPSEVVKSVRRRVFEPLQIRTHISDLFQLNIRSTYDAISIFGVIEHLHSSPKKLLERLWNALKPNGKMVVTVPNAVNLRKRLSVLFGRSNYPSFRTFWNADIWRGHVREYTVEELYQIATSLRCRRVRVLGRNDMLYDRTRTLPYALLRLVDRVMRRFPQLCSDLLLFMGK